MTTFNGILQFYSETGTEGGYWAMQDDDNLHGKADLVDGRCPWTPGRCPVEAGDWHEHGRYESLHVMKDGDQLTVYTDASRTAVRWSGTIKLTQYPLFTADIARLWVHSLPDVPDMIPEEWVGMFFAELPCTLETT